MSSPQLVIVGGPNGAGKTTFALEYAAETGLDYLGADAIADEMSPANPGSVQTAAARIFIDRLKNALAQRKPLVIESTLSGRTLHRHIESARQNSYRVTIIFVFLATETGCLARIQERVARGGHNVPEEDVRRRFPRTFRQFWTDYRMLADDWAIFSNGGEAFELVASGSGEETEVNDESLFEDFVKIVENAI
ncbi:MAG: AAA family ATPase [Gammaproteobacteria bacterium]